MKRRDFHEKAILVLGGIIQAALALPTAVYLLLPGKKKGSGGFVDVGSIASLPDGEPTEISFQRPKVDAWKESLVDATAWVLREGEKVTAFGPSCPHLGCGYVWNNDRSEFVCPCHDSFFNKDGGVVSGPSPRPLDRFETRVENGRLFLGQVHKADEAEG